MSLPLIHNLKVQPHPLDKKNGSKVHFNHGNGLPEAMISQLRETLIYNEANHRCVIFFPDGLRARSKSKEIGLWIINISRIRILLGGCKRKR